MMMSSTHFKKRYSITYDTCTYILLFGLLITVAFTYHMYGFTTDELVDHLKATRIFEFIASGGSEREQILKIDLINIYGALPDMLALALEKLIPALSFDSRHLVSALFGLAGIYYAYRVGSVFVSPSVGFITVLLLTFNPMWFGYMFINAKDIPFATTLLAAFYYSLCALTGRDESQWCWARVGLAAGLLASTKLIGVLVLGLIGFLALAALVAVPTSSRLRIDPVFFYRLLMTAISALVGSLICFAVFWPQFFLWSPAQIFGVVRLFMNFDQWRGYVQIHGSYFSAATVPWYYLSTYFAISMPLFLLPLTAAGAIGGVLNREPLIISSLIACVLFFTYQAVTGARVALNGYRHFLFLLPFVTLVAAYPIGRLLESRLFIVRVAALAVAAAGSVTAAVSMYQLFPYQYSFYNKLVGGIQGADGKYEIDVWRSALREALRKFSVMADTNDVVRIYTCGSALNFKEHPLFRLVESEKREDADYIVALRRVCDAAYFQIQDLPAIGEVRRQGVLFAAIYSRPTGGWPHVKPRLQ